jgi:hypothetical protein
MLSTTNTCIERLFLTTKQNAHSLHIRSVFLFLFSLTLYCMSSVQLTIAGLFVLFRLPHFLYLFFCCRVDLTFFHVPLYMGCYYLFLPTVLFVFCVDVPLFLFCLPLSLSLSLLLLSASSISQCTSISFSCTALRVYIDIIFLPLTMKRWGTTQKKYTLLLITSCTQRRC